MSNIFNVFCRFIEAILWDFDGKFADSLHIGENTSGYVKQETWNYGENFLRNSCAARCFTIL